MPKYRLLHMNCRSGRRSRQLTRLEYLVWIGYMLSADDFGVFPASARKLQADDPWLANESTKAVQRALDVLVRTDLLRSFQDGKDTYLYQWDWQTYQKIKHPSKTSLPPIPAELLEKCCADTLALFREHHPKSGELFPLHAGACDANANANASANANANAEDRAREKSAALLMGPLQFAKLSEKNVHVGPRLRVPNILHDELRTKLGGENPDARLRAWYDELEAEVGQTGEPVIDIFEWLRPKFKVWAADAVFSAEIEKFRPQPKVMR